MTITGTETMDPQPPEKARRKRKSRGRGLRKTTGCLTCRKRHLKCDEASPSCGPCMKSSQICIYGNGGGAASSTSSSGQATIVSTPAFGQSPLPELAEEVVPWEGQIDPSLSTRDLDVVAASPSLDLERTQAASGLLHLNSAGVYEDIPPDFPNDIAYTTPGEESRDLYTADTPPDAAFSRWFGLLVQDAEYDTGPERRPSSSSSQHLLCVAPLELHDGSNRHNRRNWVGRQSFTESSYSGSPADRSLIRQLWRGSEPSKLLVREQKMFENFIKNVAPWLDLFDPTRCFSIFVPHLAMHDAGLMNAVLALSARHLSLSPNSTEEQQDRNIGLQYYYQTLHYLQKAMRHDSYTTSLELLATALIVSKYEMLDDQGSGGWERHLKGVFWIQRSQVIQGESGGLKAAVWWAWLRQDVWAAFRERRKTLSFWTPTKALNTLDAHELASRSIYLFARAVDYCSSEEIEAGERSLQARIDRADVVLGLLEDWQRNLTIEFLPLPSTSNPTDAFDAIWIHPQALANSVQLNCAARILILLHRPSLGGARGFMEQQQVLVKSVNTICGIAMPMNDDASSLISSQCLFIAGMCVQDSRQREALVSMIDACQHRTGWPTRSLSGELSAEWRKIT